MLLNMFFIYLVAFATEAAAFSSKRTGRMAADKNSLSNIGEVEKRNAFHYTGHNGRESGCIDTESGLKCQSKRRIRRRGPPLQKRRQKIHTKGEKLQCPGEGCELPWGNKRPESSPLKSDPLYAIEKEEEISATDLLPQATSEETVNVAQDNKQHAIKYRSLGNEENPALSAEEVKGEVAGNKLLDQSPQADSDDDYDQAQEEMTQNAIKSSAEEAETNGEQILRRADEENLALVEKRHKRKYEQNNLGTLASVAEKQKEEGRLNNKKQLLVHENEVQFEEGKTRCCNKKTDYGKNKYSLGGNVVADAADEDREYGQDTETLTEEGSISNNSEDAEDQEAMIDDKPSAIENTENKMEEENVHKIQQRSETVEEKNSIRVAQKEKSEFEEKTPITGQKFTIGNDNKQAVNSLTKTRRIAREIARKGQKKKIGCQGYLEQASAILQKQTGHLSSNVDDSKSSLKGRSEGEEGGERDEEETLDTENVGDIQESNDRSSVLENKSDQQDEDSAEQNLEEQIRMNEQNQALEGNEVQEEVSETKHERREVPADEQSDAQTNLERSKNEYNKAAESDVQNKRQVSKAEMVQEESRQAVAVAQQQSLNNYGPSASENNAGKINVKRAENSERQTEENEQALTNNDKESGEEETETSSFETGDENQGLEGENLEDESDKQQLRNKHYLNNENIASLGDYSDVNIDQENFQSQVETRVQRELSKSENNNETPLEVSQSLVQEGNKEANAGQQDSLSESIDEQYEPLSEERENNNVASSETRNDLTRENREVEQQDLSKIKCSKQKNQPSLANEYDPETAEIASESDTQSAQEQSNQDETLLGGDKDIMNPEEMERETNEDYQELEQNSKNDEEQDLQSEREVEENSREQN